jgi:hypothetical protein
MEINHSATRANFDAMGFAPMKFARAKKLPPEIFRQVLNGTYRAPNSEAAKACVKALREVGVLVEVPVEQSQAA